MSALPTPPPTFCEKENEVEDYRSRLRSSARQNHSLQTPGSPRRRRRVNTAGHTSVFHVRDIQSARTTRSTTLNSRLRQPLQNLNIQSDCEDVLATPPATACSSAVQNVTSTFSEDVFLNEGSHPNNRSLAQRERRRREREQREREQREREQQEREQREREQREREQREREQREHEGHCQRAEPEHQELRYVWMGDVEHDGLDRMVDRLSAPGANGIGHDSDDEYGAVAEQQRVALESVPTTGVPPARRPYKDPDARHYLGRMSYPCRSCRALHWIDEKLASSSLSSPIFTACCDHGTVDIALLEYPPQPLLRFFTEEHDPQSRNFREHIIEYNRALAFTSLGVSEDHTVNAGRGRPVFRIHGELHHLTGSLLTPPQRHAVYAQLYFYDPRTSLNLRMENNAGSRLREDTMEALQAVVNEHNQYAPLYQHAFEVLQNYDDTADVSIRLRVVPGTVRSQPALQGDIRTYRPPTADEVCVIYPEDPSAEWRDIVLRRRSGRLERISECHPAYAPLQYVLLFPYGESGWFPELPIRNTRNRQKHTKVTLTSYTAFRLHDREGEFSCLLRGGRLLQRYIVDMWAAADQKNLTYLHKNQHLFRCHISSGLTDAFTDADGDINLQEIGQRVILPSSYHGGPRYMHERFQDSMAIARHFKKVDLFITMTCNPKWKEIQDELRIFETAYDRPDLVARVFRLKKDALLRDILKNGVLGHVVAHVYTIEFQKRGLPHMHLLIFFDAAHKLTSPEEIDKLIWARWPDREKYPLLFETVKNCMVHGPCGMLKPNAVCMDPDKKICTKHFPKDFCDATNMDGNGYPQYFRPDNGITVDVQHGFAADNRWIVPYCPFLSGKYDCHINVECAISINSLKYVFKYIQKGNDRAIMELHQRDEIKRWVDGRYVTPSEASWRIFGYELHELYPTVTRLAIHLPGQHMVVYDPDEDPREVQHRAASEKSTLTEFFAVNRDTGELGVMGRQLTYMEFPQHFVWVKNADKYGRKHYWKKREQRGLALGRIYYVPPTAGEKFHLRTLLTVVKGATSFQDLRTYNGVIYATFEEACFARGLIEDDGEWDRCLQEAGIMQTGSCLRQLFTTLLLFCDVLRADRLWENHRSSICDDLHHRLENLGYTNITEDQVYDYGLFLIDKLLRASGKSLADFRLMPQPQRNWDETMFNPLIAEQLNYREDEQQALFEQRIASFNDEQLSAYHAIMDSINGNLGSIFFLNGPGGTGKTYVYNTICNKVRSEGNIAIPVASSGIASLLITGGRTAHSTFKIPVSNLHSQSICSIPKDSERAELLRHTSLIIWDEAAAQHRYAIEAVDRIMRDVRGVSDQLFGGVTVLFGGDFQQTLPVVRGGPAQVIHATLIQSELWKNIKILHLRQNMRLGQTPADQRYSSWLLDVGHGRNLRPDGTIKIPQRMLCNNKNDLIDFIYPDIPYHVASIDRASLYFKDRMILAPRNVDVWQLNEQVLSRIDTISRTYFSADALVEEDGSRNSDRRRNVTDWSSTNANQPLPPEVLRAIDDPSLPPGELTIKLGCPLILLRNLSPANGLCNGTRCIVTAMEDRVIQVRIMGGEHDGSTALIPRITLFPSDTSTSVYNYRRRQFPVRLAFALSINKSQGQSVKYVGLHLQNPVFSHGQLYVAFSRATSADRVKVLLPSGCTTTKNIVYPEVLLD